MPASPEVFASLVSVKTEGAGLCVALRGRWRTIGPRADWATVIGDQKPDHVRIAVNDVESWDSAMLLFLGEAQAWSRSAKVPLDISGLPKKLLTLLGQLTEAQSGPTDRARHENIISQIGQAALDSTEKSKEVTKFVGVAVLAVVNVLRNPRQFRWRDCLVEMQQCGAMALPIVSLISLLVGLIMAYQAAVQLRQFGADIYVADLVGLSVIREMGPMMAAVIIAGRTGAAFAATLGNMKANEEIDALETLGVSPVEFLVLPRMVALAVMMPLLALYANLLGVLGGMVVALGVLEIPPAAYWVELQTIVDLSDICTGLFKATTFGLLIGLAGCLRGLQADRSAAGVGQAATSAVVTGILAIIVADAIFAVVFNILGV